MQIDELGNSLEDPLTHQDTRRYTKIESHPGQKEPDKLSIGSHGALAICCGLKLLTYP